jgi:hypothetical protein
LRGSAQPVKLPLMFLRSIIRVAEWTGGILAGLALVVGGGMWLLSRGPLSLDWLAPYVASTFSQSEPGVSAHVDHTFISLGEGPSLEIIARGLHLKRTDGQAELTLPDVGLSLSPQAALRGQVAPTLIVLHGPRLHLLRSEDGSFHLGLADEQPTNNDWAESLLHELAQPDREGAFGYLNEIRVTDAALTVDDRKLGVTWEAQRLDATLRRGNDGFAGDLALMMERGGHTAQLHGDYQFEATAQRLRMALSFDDLRPSLYAAAAPALAPFAAFELPLGGQISMTLDIAARRVNDFWCDLELGEGRIVNDRFEGGALKIVRGTLRAVYDPTTRRLDLEHFNAELNTPNRPILDFAGAIEQFDPLATAPLRFTGLGRIHGLDFTDLERIWPAQAGVHAREWLLTHLQQGQITHGEISLAGTVSLGSPAGLVAKLDKIAGDIAYRNVTVQYFPPLAAVRDINGTAHFDRTQFVMHPDGGMVRDVRATGTIVLSKLDTDDEQAQIDLKLAGPLATALDELNSKPLRYARTLGVDPAAVKGSAEGELHFHLPMKKNLRMSMIEYSAQGKLTGVEIDKILFGRNLTAGALDMRVNRGGVDLDGTANLDGVPVTLNWKENFSNDPIRTRYRLRGVFDEPTRHQLGIDWLPQQVSGPIGIDLSFARHRNNFAESDATLDLTKATLVIEKLGWTKKAGIPATAHLVISARNELSVRISDFSVRGGGLEAQLELALTGSETDAKIAHANIYRLSVGHTDVTGVIERRPDGGWAVRLRGKSFDASRLLDDVQSETTGTAREPPLSIDADLDQMTLGPGRVIDNVHANLFSDGVHWQTAQIDATPSPGKKLTLRFGGPVGDRNFRLASDDLGAVLRLLDISSNVHGGRVSVSARAEDEGPRRVLRGKLDGANYRLVEAPAFAKLLSLASFTGAASLANGQGIPFSRVQGDFVLSDGAVELRNARAYGEAMGINASGKFDYRHNRIDMSGTIVPAYLLNSLLGNIPVLGDLLLGGKGEGIFAANFRVAGSTTDPGISVNPLSALAPGFLRGLFLFDAGSPDKDSARGTVTPNGG